MALFYIMVVESSQSTPQGEYGSMCYLAGRMGWSWSEGVCWMLVGVKGRPNCKWDKNDKKKDDS